MLFVRSLRLFPRELVQCDPKNLLKRDAFCEKFEIISPLTSKDEMAGIFLLLKKPFYYLKVHDILEKANNREA